jgi:hypothetical protein
LNLSIKSDTMKKIFAITSSILLVTLFATIVIMPGRAISSSNMKSGSSFPDSVGSILEKSCYPCHSEPGNGMAMRRVNFDKWDGYSAEKQTDKAKDICKMVTKGKMPTSSFKKNNPDKVPTDKEVSILCNWAASFEKK